MGGVGSGTTDPLVNNHSNVSMEQDVGVRTKDERSAGSGGVCNTERTTGSGELFVRPVSPMRNDYGEKSSSTRLKSSEGGLIQLIQG